MNSFGKAAFRTLIAAMTGPFGADAWDPVGSFALGSRGTPKRITEDRPFWTKGVRQGTSLLMPRLVRKKLSKAKASVGS